MPASRIRFALVLVATLAACTSRYGSMYKGSAPDARGLRPDQVTVHRSRGEVTQGWVELGSYRGHAPTEKEALDGGQRECGRHGADLFILNTAPFASEGVFKVDGICAKSDEK